MKEQLLIEQGRDLLSYPTDTAALDALRTSVGQGVRAVTAVLESSSVGALRHPDELRRYWIGVAAELVYLQQIELAAHAVLAERSPVMQAAVGRAAAEHRAIADAARRVDQGFVELVIDGRIEPVTRSIRSLDDAVAALFDVEVGELRVPLQRVLDVVDHDRLYAGVAAVHDNGGSFRAPFVASWIAPTEWKRIRDHRLLGGRGTWLAHRRHRRLAEQALGERRAAILDDRAERPAARRPRAYPDQPRPVSRVFVGW